MRFCVGDHGGVLLERSARHIACGGRLGVDGRRHIGPGNAHVTQCLYLIDLRPKPIARWSLLASSPS